MDLMLTGSLSNTNGREPQNSRRENCPENRGFPVAIPGKCRPGQAPMAPRLKESVRLLDLPLELVQQVQGCKWRNAVEVGFAQRVDHLSR